MTKKKRIVLLTANYPHGGASANLLRLFTKGLSELGIEIRVWLPTGHFSNDLSSHNITKKGSIDGVTYRHLFFLHHPHNIIGKIADNFLGSLLTIIYLIKESISNKLDIIIVYNTTLTNTLLLVIVKYLIRKKLIIILPEFYEKPKTKYFSYAMLNWCNFYFGLRFIAKYADGLIVLTTYLKNYYCDLGKQESKILIMPNLTDPAFFKFNNVSPFKKGFTTIGYSGTPTKKDGIIDLIESFKLLHERYPKTHLLIIGDTLVGKSVLPNLSEIVKKYNIDSNVTFTGLVAYPSMPALLNSCQILALTRPNGIFAETGFPTKLGEYFACRKPVLITSVGDVSLYFKNEDHLIIVNPEDIEGIAQGFEKLINDADLSNRLCINAYDWMQENLYYKRVSKKIFKFILSV